MIKNKSITVNAPELSPQKNFNRIQKKDVDLQAEGHKLKATHFQ